MPNFFAYEWQDADTIVLTWEPPTVTDYTEAAVGYNVYVFEDDKPLTPEVVYAPETESTFDLAQGHTYTFFVRAFGVSNVEGQPTAPQVFRWGIDYPRCGVVQVGLTPPFYNLQAGCLMPLPP